MRTIPSREEFLKGCNAYEKHEKRDSMYKVSTFLVYHFWGNLMKWRMDWEFYY